MELKRHPKLLDKNGTALLVIDIQEKILPVIFEHERVLKNTKKLISGFKILQLPVFYTEQYPKGLGPTENTLLQMLVDMPKFEKLSFSCIGAGNLFAHLKSKSISRVVVCGIESHVCVMQTSFDLIANGFEVYLAADAVSSRRKFDFEVAIERMRSNGIDISLTESILFELLNLCGTPEFKEISKIVKEL
jgi:nicotinamidase-related amidase